MALDNQGAVRGAPRIAPPPAAPARAPAEAAATGFSELLGAAEEPLQQDPETDTADSDLDADKEDKPAEHAARKPANDDAATLAAWAGLLAPPAAAASAVGGAGGTNPPADAVAGIKRFAFNGARGGVANGAAVPVDAGGAATSKFAKLIPPGGQVQLPDASAQALATNNALPAANAKTLGADTSPLQPAAAGAGSGQATSPAALAAQAASRARATVTGAADAAAAAQSMNVSTTVSTTAAMESPASTGRGAASTVSLGDGNQGRWVGLLSDIARPLQAEAGAGGMAGGGSQSRQFGGGGDNRPGDGAGAMGIGFAASAPSADSAFPSSSTGEASGAGGAAVMSADEWLEATTPAISARGVQTAEMTLDAFGSPVDVRISLSGADAQVDFQTDQADTRALLGGAVGDLQNLLQQEGLVLSGVSIGSSNTGNAAGFAGEGGGQRRGQTAPPSTVELGATAPVAAASARSAAATARGGLDLFA